jgi:hypothetical protein
MTAERAKEIAKEALKAGGDPRLARQVLLSTLTGEKGGPSWKGGLWPSWTPCPAMRTGPAWPRWPGERSRR